MIFHANSILGEKAPGRRVYPQDQHPFDEDRKGPVSIGDVVH